MNGLQITLEERRRSEEAAYGAVADRDGWDDDAVVLLGYIDCFKAL